ncbi:unnamed protein product, partial [Prorocentrum cordatum]
VELDQCDHRIRHLQLVRDDHQHRDAELLHVGHGFHSVVDENDGDLLRRLRAGERGQVVRPTGGAVRLRVVCPRRRRALRRVRLGPGPDLWQDRQRGLLRVRWWSPLLGDHHFHLVNDYRVLRLATVPSGGLVRRGWQHLQILRAGTACQGYLLRIQKLRDDCRPGLLRLRRRGGQDRHRDLPHPATSSTTLSATASSTTRTQTVPPAGYIATTVLVSPVLAGASELAVESEEAHSVGDIIMIAGGGNAETRGIASFGSIVLDPSSEPLDHGYPAGSSLYRYTEPGDAVEDASASGLAFALVLGLVAVGVVVAWAGGLLLLKFGYGYHFRAPKTHPKATGHDPPRAPRGRAGARQRRRAEGRPRSTAGASRPCRERGPHIRHGRSTRGVTAEGQRRRQRQSRSRPAAAAHPISL